MDDPQHLEPGELALTHVVFVEDRNGRALVRLGNGSTTSLDYGDLRGSGGRVHIVDGDVRCLDCDWHLAAPFRHGRLAAFVAHLADVHGSTRLEPAEPGEVAAAVSNVWRALDVVVESLQTLGRYVIHCELNGMQPAVGYEAVLTPAVWQMLDQGRRELDHVLELLRSTWSAETEHEEDERVAEYWHGPSEPLTPPPIEWRWSQGLDSETEIG